MTWRLCAFVLAIWFVAGSAAHADCWRLRNGQIVETSANSTPPAVGARRVACPTPTPSVQGGARPSAIWARPVSQFTAFNQRNAQDRRLYASAEWALANEDVEGTPRWNWTCLSVVYAMIEHARGNTSYRVGPDTYRDRGGGAVAISGASRSEVSPTVERLREQFAAGNPVILVGTSTNLGPGHYMLAIGLNAAGDVEALDPWSGSRIQVSTATWRTSNGAYRIRALRTIRF